MATIPLTATECELAACILRGSVGPPHPATKDADAAILRVAHALQCAADCDRGIAQPDTLGLPLKGSREDVKRRMNGVDSFHRPADPAAWGDSPHDQEPVC